MANRIGEIHESTSPEQWRQVPGKLNPNDKATLSSDEFVKAITWLYGPSLLYKDESKWPEQHYDVPEDAVKEKNSMLESYITLLSEPWICCEKFSKLLKTKRVVAWSLRFINNINVRREERRLGEPSVREIQKAEQILIGFAKKEGFLYEIVALKLCHPLPAKSPFGQLNPVLDSDRLLRMKGCLELAKHLPAETRNPTLMPRKDHITALIVAQHHEQRNHSAGISHVLSNIRTRYWIICGQEAVKSWESRCNECKRRHAKTSRQIMAPLSLSRLGMPVRAFARCGGSFSHLVRKR